LATTAQAGTDAASGSPPTVTLQDAELVLTALVVESARSRCQATSSAAPSLSALTS